MEAPDLPGFGCVLGRDMSLKAMEGCVERGLEVEVGLPIVDAGSKGGHFSMSAFRSHVDVCLWEERKLDPRAGK